MPDQALQQIVERMVAAGESEADIALVIQSYKPAAPAQPAQAPGFLDDNAGLPMMARAGLGVLRFVKNNPAQAGAIAGGLAAAPLTGATSLIPAMAASGLGAAGGAGVGLAAQQIATGKPQTAGNVAGTMAKEGALAVTGEGIGRGLTTIAGKVAPKIARAVMKPSKSLQNEFGADNLTDAFLAERVPVGQSGTITARAKDSAATADKMIAEAESGGSGPVSLRSVAQELRPVVDKAKTRIRLGQADETPTIVGRLRAMRGANPEGIPLTVAQEMKREAQGMAERGFRAADSGNVLNDLGAHADKAVATGLRQGIEARVPGVRDVNANTQRLIGLEQALTDAEARNPGLVGINPLQWLGSMFPGVGSRVAFGANAASKAPAGQLLQATLLSLLGATESPE